jgi:hypothetical protein
MDVRELFKNRIVWGSCLATVVILMFIIALSGGHKGETAKVLKTTPQNTTVHAEVGGNATLNCALEFPNKKALPYFVSWTKYTGERLDWMETYSSKRKNNEKHYLILETAKLSITNLTWEDGGQYECKVFFGTQPSKDKGGTWFNLEIEPTKEPVDATAGEKVTLLCGANNLPSYIPFQWTKDGKLLPSSNHTMVTNTITGTLTIHRAEKHDSGLYACELKSEKLQKYYPMTRYLLTVHDNASKPGGRGKNSG